LYFLAQVVSDCKPRLTATTAIKTDHFSTADSPTTPEKYRYIAPLRRPVGLLRKKTGVFGSFHPINTGTPRATAQRCQEGNINMYL
jgi:hypothetical protein